ncbi:hypothetical protein [Rubritalea marina]|uniref:hypothetical protein n=1 Tax=Rubritalea marina TaxID=361055 RepID=UPI00036D09C2|nr:hypothetical protein [Rubritalea marina]
MKTIHPRTIKGKDIAIFVHDVDGNSGGSAVLFGVARYEDEQFFVERSQEPHMFPIPESAWPSLKVNDNPKAGELFEEAPFVVRLILRPMPDDTNEDDFEKLNIPILDQD